MLIIAEISRVIDSEEYDDHLCHLVSKASDFIVEKLNITTDINRIKVCVADEDDEYVSNLFAYLSIESSTIYLNASSFNPNNGIFLFIILLHEYIHWLYKDENFIYNCKFSRKLEEMMVDDRLLEFMDLYRNEIAEICDEDTDTIDKELSYYIERVCD